MLHKEHINFYPGTHFYRQNCSRFEVMAHKRRWRRSAITCIAGGKCEHIYMCTPTWPGIQSEDTIYTRVYSVFVPAFKARTNLCITHSKWGHFFTHLWTCLARTKRGLRPYPPTPILWQREDSAHSHKARTEILTSLCQNVLTLNVKNWFWSSLWMPGRTQWVCKVAEFWFVNYFFIYGKNSVCFILIYNWPLCSRILKG